MTTHLKYDNFNIDLLVMEQKKKKNLYIRALVSHIFPDYVKVWFICPLLI